jgi:PAS domain S-box-containing protein
LFVPPRHSILVSGTINVLGQALFLLVGLIIVLLSESLRDEQRLSENRRRWLEVTLASIGDGVICANERGQVTFLNGRAEALTGWRLSEAAGRPLLEVFRVVQEEHRTAALDPMRAVLGEGRLLGMDEPMALISRDGAERPIDDSAAPIRDESGEVGGVVLIFRDATERRRSERQVREAKEGAEAANRAKDFFLAALSHELRTPLAPVLLMVSDLESTAAVDPSLREDLRTIRRNVEVEARLIDDLLDVTRIQQGKLELAFATVDVHELLRHAAGICRGDVEAKEQTLALDLKAEHTHLRCDGARLLQVLWNLIKNAVKFTPRGGRITIATADLAPGRLAIEVIDTGIGIAPEVLPKLFDAFEQGGPSITRRFGGLGLGLAISKNLIEAHGGSLSATSPGAGRGATFRIELPGVLEPAQTGIHAAGADRGGAHQSASILLVEDHADTARILARILGKMGHRVTVARSAGEALSSAGPFDLLLCDLGLPDGNGLDLIRQLPPMPAIALTGHGMEDDIRASRAAGFLAHLTKPVDPEQLEAAIQKVMRNE